MFKKLVLGAILFGSALNAFAGQYDGVWQISGESTYDVLYTDATGLTISASVEPGGAGLYGKWVGTGIGNLVGNVFTGTFDEQEDTLSVTITFSSANTGTAVIKSCTPKLANGCVGMPLNTPVPYNRVL